MIVKSSSLPISINMERTNFEKFEKRRSGSRWFWVVGSKDNPGELV